MPWHVNVGLPVLWRIFRQATSETQTQSLIPKRLSIGQSAGTWASVPLRAGQSSGSWERPTCACTRAGRHPLGDRQGRRYDALIRPVHKRLPGRSPCGVVVSSGAMQSSADIHQITTSGGLSRKSVLLNVVNARDSIHVARLDWPQSSKEL